MFILVTAFYATPVWLQTEVFKMENQQKKKKVSPLYLFCLEGYILLFVCLNYI